MDLKLITFAMILNLSVVVLNIVIAFLNLNSNNINIMIFNLGCGICSGLIAVVCAIEGIKNK